MTASTKATNSWKEQCRCICSIYTLNETDKIWQDTCKNGTMTMYQNSKDSSDIRLFWIKKGSTVDTNGTMVWRLQGSKLKPKGERAAVIKAWEYSKSKQEIIAIRFKTAQSATTFATKYSNFYPNTVDLSSFKQATNENWTCRACTLLNDSTRTQCIECKISRYIDDGTAMYGMNEKWSCPMCTFENTNDITVCEVCRLDKDKSKVTEDKYQSKIKLGIEKKKSIVSAYCRDIESKLNQKGIIPSNVVHLCTAYYVNVK